MLGNGLCLQYACKKSKKTVQRMIFLLMKKQYFNNILGEDKLKNKYISFYNTLKEMPKEEISLERSEFNGDSLIKFAYLNGLEIEE